MLSEIIINAIWFYFYWIIIYSRYIVTFENAELSRKNKAQK